MAETNFRLRINFQKIGRLRFLSHLELVRALERCVRRAGLPYVVSQGFNVHMRYAPGPALPVGTESFDEYFDVWLTTYIDPWDALIRLQAVSAPGLPVKSVAYVDTRAKGLQATHIFEDYRVVIEAAGLSLDELMACFDELIKGGELKVAHKGSEKVHDLGATLRKISCAQDKDCENRFILDIALTSTEQGSIRPDALTKAALGPERRWEIVSVTRIHLAEECLC